MKNKTSLDLEMIKTEKSKDGKMLKVWIGDNNVAYNILVIGSTVPLTVTTDVHVKEFHLLPFEQERGLIILWANDTPVGKMAIVYVSMKDACPYLHKMNKDDMKWFPSLRYPTQFVGQDLEVLIDGDRFSTKINSSCFSVDGDMLARYLNEEISANDVRLKALGSNLPGFASRRKLEYSFELKPKRVYFFAPHRSDKAKSMLVVGAIAHGRSINIIFRRRADVPKFRKLCKSRNMVSLTVHPENRGRIFRDGYKSGTFSFGKSQEMRVYLVDHHIIDLLKANLY